MSDPHVGARVLVPLGKRTVTGVVLEVPPPSSSHLPSRLAPRSSPLAPLTSLLDADAFLPASVVALAAWVSDYYACGVGEAIATAMPPRAWIESERHVRITEAGDARMLRERGARRDVLDRLSGGRIVSVASLTPARRDGAAGKRRISHAVIAELEADGLIELTQPLKGSADASRTIRVARLTVQGADDVPDVRLGARQQQAVELLRAAPGGLPLAVLAREDIPAESLERLAKLGLVTLERRRVERDPFAARVVAAPATMTLTAEQQAAFDRLSGLAAARTFHAALLHGVTGSG
jgi:primosomal protein N' (replication factor Y)